jgi:hypothetical protein
MNTKKYFLSSLIILLTGIMYSPVQAQQKKGTHRANFSGEWKSIESISMRGNIFCTYEEGDRMSSKTMKIAEHVDFLTIDVPSPSPRAALNTSQEKLTFDGKEYEINYGRERGKKFTVKWSADGQTMTVNSIIHQKQAIFYVTEVWKLSNDGKSITVQTNAKSNMAEAPNKVEPFRKLQNQSVQTEVPIFQKMPSSIGTILKNKDNAYTTISRIDGIDERSWKTVFVKAN